ncbi:DUF892 family protein [Deinococcus ficus]|uniref:DUF892 family protein n=1 Tax=Deinococcus ficus TaxID=317577 RepID=UPI00174C82FB|nr:DUF892 family protein [Deinococcus ficus]GHF77577.1 hypothetical protein GCM10017782_14430 [Deinococcus ficus]
MAKIEVKLQDLHDLYLEQLRDLYSAETQLLKALPKMAASATDPDLKQGFEDHLVQTQEQVGRLEGLFQELEQDPGLIAAAQRIEHYEIAGYGTVAAYADLLGLERQAMVLRTTLEEEKETDARLTLAAREINVEAAEG